MSLVNTQGSLNTGRDCTIVLITAFGQVDLGNVTGFEAQMTTQNLRVDRLDGVVLNAELPKGWSGTLDADRANPAVEAFFAQTEQAWIVGGSYQVATMYQYINEADGSTSVWAYDNVAMKFDAGSWKSDAAVRQRIHWEANRRRQV